MRYSLKTKLAISYIILALVCVGLISIFANMFLEKHFREYIIKNIETRNKEIVSMVENQYSQYNGWNQDTVSNIGMSALENALILKIKDNTGKTIWDATHHNSGLCNAMLDKMARNMNSRYVNWQGKYTESIYPIMVDARQVGTAEIGYYGPFYFTDSDLKFINTLNSFLLSTALFSLMVSMILGAIMGRRISTPIASVINSTQRISQGHFTSKIDEKSNTIEINQLITSVNDLAANLENQEILRKRMTADVSHELRTPLATLQSHLEAMMDGIWQPTAERLKSCHEEIIRISKMVGDLEKLSKIENEKFILNKSEFDITELAANILRNFDADFIKKNIEVGLIGEAAVVYGDRDKLSQVLINLLSNALKYTNEDGKVEVGISQSEGKTILRVKDNGVGISAEDLPHIFERFYRADKSRNRLTGGAGIGLAIVKSVIEAHNGIIEVESKENEGTEVIVKLP